MRRARLALVFLVAVLAPGACVYLNTGSAAPQLGEVLRREIRLVVEHLCDTEETFLNRNERERLIEEVGDLLFACVNLARHLDVEPESALRTANLKFERRFAQVESALQASGGVEQASLAEMDAAWEAAKRREQQP